MSTDAWIQEAVALKSAGMSYGKIAARFRVGTETVRRHVKPFIDQMTAQSQEMVKAEQEQPKEPEYDPLDHLPTLNVSDGDTVRPVRPDELPVNVALTIPQWKFLRHAIPEAFRHPAFRAPLGVVVGLGGIVFNLAVSLAVNGPLWAIPLVMLAAFVLWYIVSTKIMLAKVLRPAKIIRKDSYGRRGPYMEKWWAWDALTIHDSIKIDYQGKRLIYLDASDNVVRIFNAYAAQLPRLDIDPNDTDFEVTTESLADLPSMMKDVKNWVKDEEPDKQIMVRQGIFAMLILGSLFAIYWAWLSFQDALAA